MYGKRAKGNGQREQQGGRGNGRARGFLRAAALAGSLMGAGMAAAQQLDGLKNCASTEEAVLAAAGRGVAVLDTRSTWRMFSIMGPPTVRDAGNLRRVSFGVAWLDTDSAPAPATWAAAGFDDAGWARGPLSKAPNTPMLTRLYIRGRFTVEDPAAVKTLSLLVNHRGGIVVYLNGAAIGRSHVRGGAGDAVMAEEYPREAFIDDTGMPVVPTDTVTLNPRPPSTPENQRRGGLWERYAQVELPAAELRRGANVIALEVIGAPQDGGALAESRRQKAFPMDFFGATCRVARLQLRAQDAGGLTISVTRPQGLRVWNADVLESDHDSDFANPAEPLRPVRIAGPRNGVFSGKVCVGSTEPLTGLSAVMGELRGPGGLIPAAAVRVRYGVNWGMDNVYFGRDGTWAPNREFHNGISATPLPQYAVGGADAKTPAGSVAPVWVTVRIPKDAAPGAYAGTLTVAASGQRLPVPVSLKVLPWTLPDSQDFRTWVDLIQSPDTLAVEYNIPLWSEKHFAMIAESFSLIRDTGSRTLYLPAISHTNLGNEQSMIRWIRKPGGGYDWDFSVMDRYLDTAKANLGMPKLVCLQVWDVYMRDAGPRRFADFRFLGAPQATVLDPATGKTENALLPPLSDPASRELWQSLIAKVRERLRQRGMEKALMLGMFCDAWPSKEDIAFFLSVAPDLAWVQQGHGLVAKVQGLANVGYNASVWGGYRFADGCRQTNQRGAPTTEALYGWSRPSLDAVFERNTKLDLYPPPRWYFFPETAITGELRGIGRVGADYWKAVRDKNGKRAAFVHERYAEGSWGGRTITLIACNPVLSPGREGPEATNRLIALIEGVQMCEARISIEREIQAGLSGNLKTRCEAALQQRLFTMWRSLSNHMVMGGWGGAQGWRWVPAVAGNQYFLGSGWQEDAETLYGLAAEVQQKGR